MRDTPLDDLVNNFDARMEAKKKQEREVLQPSDLPEMKDKDAKIAQLEATMALYEAATDPGPRPERPYVKPSFERYDDEMSVEEIADPKLAAAVEELAKRRLDPDDSPEQTIEAQLALYEKNYIASAARRWTGQQRWMGAENEKKRLVNLMTPAKFITLLQRIGVDASIEPNPTSRISLNSFTELGLIGVGGKHKGALKTLTVLQYPIGPEFTVMRFDEYDVPTTRKYQGWRSALLALILQDVITEDEALRAFGPCVGDAGEFYREQLFLYRTKNANGTVN